MKEYSDKEIKEKIGRYGIFSGGSKRLFELKLIGGVDFLERNNEQGFGGTKLEILKDGSLEINTGSWKTSAVIKMKDLIFVTVEKQDAIYDKKNKSIVGRALLGGFLLGPVGAIVGGMTGIGDKTVKNKQLPDFIITFKIKDSFSQEENVMLFECKEKDFPIVDQFLRKYFNDKVVDPEKVLENVQKDDSNNVEDLMKLKKLLDEGLLTDVEFENEKHKILNNYR